MPYQWNAERERKMLLLAISSANLRPSADTWQRVAALLGDGLTASAVSQKYYKLRKESDAQAGTPPATPKKRKACDDDEEEKKKPTPSKRPREAPRDPIIDGVPFSDASDSPPDFKAEEMAASVLGLFQSHQALYSPAAYYPVVNTSMDGHLYGEFNGHGSGQSSFIG
ncbi:hypothetical protein H2200_010735 [Cladophialophora chaetospira]|uniref:Myb-like domain-containing protein n=1 Tax=Cladophialophora chaetospira TaxID=386627 RepID=A0AA38X0M7_9EURO|nr:hypothetical protein H2200_010735 [Cladophialophora chaetospira]